MLLAQVDSGDSHRGPGRRAHGRRARGGGLGGGRAGGRLPRAERARRHAGRPGEERLPARGGVCSAPILRHTTLALAYGCKFASLTTAAIPGHCTPMEPAPVVGTDSRADIYASTGALQSYAGRLRGTTSSNALSAGLSAYHPNPNHPRRLSSGASQRCILVLYAMSCCGALY